MNPEETQCSGPTNTERFSIAANAQSHYNYLRGTHVGTATNATSTVSHSTHFTEALAKQFELPLLEVLHLDESLQLLRIHLKFNNKCPKEHSVAAEW